MNLLMYNAICKAQVKSILLNSILKSSMKKTAKPFLKWAGGKTQLIVDIEKSLPSDFKTSNYTYIEPFIGSGAVMFWLLNSYKNIKKAVINDINVDLINTYKTISKNPKDIISILQILQNEFHELDENEEKKKEYFYQKRLSYNSRKSSITDHSALFIFLNRTCFNGLYRVNKKNEFNVPMGNYKRPMICDKENLLLVSELLQNVEILNGDYQSTIDYASGKTLFYFDPPYKPLNITSSFNSYAKEEFNDTDQIRLRDFCLKIDLLQYSWILSNSDVRNVDAANDFFDVLYSNFKIQRVEARRSINSKSEKRGILSELLITNQFK
jgi:DNA adenine methylase